MSSRTQKISLAAGQQGTILGDGRVSVVLLDGVVEIAGIILSGQQTYEFLLEDERSVTLYTLEGGSVQVSMPPSTVVDVFKCTTHMASVVTAARREAQRQKPCVVAVIGGVRTGKSHAAHTFANALVQSSKRMADPPAVYFADATGAASALTPCCLSVAELDAEHPLWPGHAHDPHRVQCSFFLGTEKPQLDAKAVPLFLLMLSQLKACSDALAKHQVAATGKGSKSAPGHVVYDLPTSDDASMPRELFYQRVLEVLQPTMVVMTTSDDVSSSTHGSHARGSGDWLRVVHEDIQRISPLTEVLTVVQSQRLCIASPMQSLRMSLRDYFSGTIAYPLGAAKVVVPLSMLRWLRVRSVVGQRDVTAEAIEPSQTVVEGTLCALSHALLDVEVPLANICGVVLVVGVSEAHDECTLIVPSGDAVLPTNVLVLPPMLDDTAAATLPWKAGQRERAAVEAAVVA